MFSDSLKPSSKLSYETFQSSSRSKISSPIAILLISIWEKIIVLSRINISFFLNGLNIRSRSGIQKFDSIFRSFINVFDKFVKVFEPHSSICKVKILPQSVH